MEEKVGKINPQELNENQIVELVKEAEKSPAEARYLLELEKYTREDLFDYIQVVYGDADVITISEDKQRGVQTKIVIPKSNPVVVIKETVSHYEQYDGEVEVHVFTFDKGWVKLK